MAILKSVYIPQLANGDFSCKFCLTVWTIALTLTLYPGIGTPLILWGQAESGVCISAASIPHLRVMLRNNPRNYFSSKYGGELGEIKLSNGPRSMTTTAITSTGRTVAMSGHTDGNTLNDDDGQGILNNESSQSVTEGGIVQSTEIAVEYHYGNDLDSHEEFGFELRKVGDS